MKMLTTTADTLRTMWRRTPLSRARMVCAISLLTMAILGMAFSSKIPAPFIHVYNGVAVVLTLINIVLGFWPVIMGRTRRLRHVRHTLLHAPNGSEFTVEMIDDPSWPTYTFTAPVAEWCRDCLSGRCGVMIRHDKDIPQDERGERTFWFQKPDDAFAFKMRWL